MLDDLVAQQAELAGLLASLDDDGWARPSRCAGWSIADVVLHIAQTNEMAIASCDGRFDDHLAAALTGSVAPGDAATAESVGAVEDGAGALVAAERGAPGPAVADRWRRSAEAQVAGFRDVPADARLRWVAGELAARTLCTTRLTECWVHTYDVAFGLDVALAPTDRLRHVARLAWRTLPYAFAGAGAALDGPVVFDLTAPSGDRWVFGGDVAPAADDAGTTTISGPALDLCLVAGQRLDPSQTALVGTGPLADDVLRLVRTFA